MKIKNTQTQKNVYRQDYKMKVKCIRGFSTNPQTLLEKDILEFGKIYEVALIIEKGNKAPDGEWDSGYVLNNSTCPFPYIWDKNRFRIIKK